MHAALLCRDANSALIAAGGGQDTPINSGDNWLHLMTPKHATLLGEGGSKMKVVSVGYCDRQWIFCNARLLVKIFTLPFFAHVAWHGNYPGHVRLLRIIREIKLESFYSSFYLVGINSMHLDKKKAVTPRNMTSDGHELLFCLQPQCKWADY